MDLFNNVQSMIDDAFVLDDQDKFDDAALKLLEVEELLDKNAECNDVFIYQTFRYPLKSTPSSP